MLEHVFPGQSEMAGRMRATDWGRTVLGPVERWSPALRTSVSTCLDCAFPIVLWWGPELAILYNDEYRPMLGAKHPAALGERGATVWAEIWDVIGPMLSQVLTQGKATRSRDLLLHIDRHGYAEEAYFSFSYSPIHEDGSGVGGIFCPVIETTDKVVGARRLRTLRDLAAECKGAESEASACGAAARVLAANPQDVPFALIYRVDEAAGRASLDAFTGFAPGAAAAPREVCLEGEDVWGLGAVWRSGQPALRTGLLDRFPGLPTGAWRTAPHSALVMPVLLPGQERPRSVLVAAVSPMRALDETYRTFFGLVATQIASGLADAQAMEVERRRAEALAEIDRAKTVFFSNVSHEFRTPLTLMLGPLEEALAGTHGVLPPRSAQALAVAHRNSLRLLKLVNTLLDFSRIEAGRMEASFEPTDLAALTADLASAFRSAVEKAGLRLVVDCRPASDPAYVDREMWEKIVLNLLGNAFKFTFEGEIAVVLDCRGDGFELSVRDTGIGIPSADLPRMFERFHRVRNARSRTHEGTGIGLALVQELVRLHGGEIAVQSEEGRGTTFTVRLRAGCAHLPGERIGAARRLASTSMGAAPFLGEALRWLPGAEPSPEVPAGEERRARLLVADDNADMREYLRTLLERTYRVEVVPDGQAALERVAADPPDLVLADVMMPRLDGFGLLQRIREDPETRTLPVILVSARAGEEASIEGRAAGADDYVTKPFSARELQARVRSQLELARLRREAEQVLRHRGEQFQTLLRDAQESRNALEEADRRKDEFLAMLAHELRNPLAPIRNALGVLRMSGGDPEAAERVLGMMERQVDHVVRLVDDLMEVSRITKGKIELRKERADLVEIVRRAVETSRPLLDEGAHRLSLALPEVPLPVEADPVRIAQVLTNLLSNAAKYTPKEGRIWLSLERSGEEAVLSVRDDGVGIPPEMLHRVFDLFMQVERTYERAQGGLGIGLTLVRRLVELHGGRVEARSEGPGRGSEFVLWLPASGVLPEPREERPAPGDRAAMAGRLVLVVDDNVDGVQTLEMLLRLMGAEVLTATDGRQALQCIRERQPSVVLLDIGLPGMDGYEVARRARLLPGGAALTLIALTGWGQDEDRRRSREAGIDHHLVKPVDFAALESLLAGLPHRAAT